MDSFLVILAIVVPLLTLGFSLYFLVYFQHPDDKWTAVFPKVVFVAGFSLGLLSLLLPLLDVANHSADFFCQISEDLSFCGGLSLAVLLQTFFVLILVCILGVIPFTIFFYEFDDLNLKTFLQKTPTKSFGEKFKSSISRIFSSCSFLIMFDIILLILLFIGFSFFSYVDLDVSTVQIVATDFTPTETTSNYVIQNLITTPSTNDEIEIQLNFILFVISFFTVLGWVLFSVYFGIGMVNLPIDLLRKFTHRPQFLSKSTYLLAKKDLFEKLKAQMQVLDTMEGKPSWKHIKSQKQLVYQLEQDFDDLETCYKNWKEYNPLVPYFKLALSGLFLVLEIIVLLHIVLYPVAEIAPFLNDVFVSTLIDTSFGLIGVVLFMVYELYLSIAYLNGIEHFGLKFLLADIHPLKMGKTLMSSLLFNLSIFLIGVPAIVHFTILTLDQVFIDTESFFIFATILQNLRYVGYIFQENIVFYVILGSMGLSAVIVVACSWCGCCTDKQLAENVKLKQRVKDLIEKNALWKETQRKSQSPVYKNNVELS